MKLGRFKLVIVIVAILILLKGLGLMMTWTIEQDAAESTRGVIKLPMQHEIVKIHSEKMTLQSPDGAMISGKIQKVIWNERALLLEIQDKNHPSKSELKLYSFKTKEITTITADQDPRLEEAELHMKDLKPIQNYFSETKDE